MRGKRAERCPTEELLRAVGDGDQGAFASLVEHLGVDCWRLTRLVTGGDAAVAARAYVDAMGAVWRQAPRFDVHDLPAEQWVYGLVQAQARRHRDDHDDEPRPARGAF